MKRGDVMRRAEVWTIRRCPECSRCFEAKRFRAAAGGARFCSRLCSARAIGKARRALPLNQLPETAIGGEDGGDQMDSAGHGEPGDDFRPRLDLPRSAVQRRAKLNGV